MYYATDYEKIARYIGLNVPFTLKEGYRWNVYVHEGRIRQIGLSNTLIKMRKFLCLLNYGSFNLTYTMVAVNDLVCGPLRQFNGGSSYQQFSALNETGQAVIRQAIDTALVQKGNDITANAEIIQDAAAKNIGYGAWTVVISDPSARFGYYACMIIPQTWFLLRGYKDFKWNYFGSVHQA